MTTEPEWERARRDANTFCEKRFLAHTKADGCIVVSIEKLLFNEAKILHFYRLNCDLHFKFDGNRNVE
jgi:hypothetical protein